MTTHNVNDGQFINAVKGNVAFYLPILFEFIPENDSFWKEADKNFNSEIEWRRGEAEAAEGSIQAEITIFDVILLAKRGNGEGIRYLHFLRSMFDHLFNNLVSVERALVKRTFKTILKKLDFRYKDFVGELAVLNNMISTKKYRLEDVEAPLADSPKTIDFKVRDLNTNECHLVEVYNIHVDSDKVQPEPERIKAFFTHRLTQKIASKETQMQFELVTVLWGGWRDLLVYSNYFKAYAVHLVNVHEPMAYLTFSEVNDGSFFQNRFKKISRLFDSE